MFVIQCTKRLLEELKIDIEKETMPISNPIFLWHSHLFLLNRKKCVIVMNNKTRFNFILFGLKRADFINFNSIVLRGIEENLLAEGISDDIIDKYLEGCNKVTYATSSDRSIISQMNEMKRNIEYIFKRDKAEGVETDIQELNRWLNRFVMLKLAKLYSGETMKEELMELFSSN